MEQAEIENIVIEAQYISYVNIPSYSSHTECVVIAIPKQKCRFWMVGINQFRKHFRYIHFLSTKITLKFIVDEPLVKSSTKNKYDIRLLPDFKHERTTF